MAADELERVPRRAALLRPRDHDRPWPAAGTTGRVHARRRVALVRDRRRAEGSETSNERHGSRSWSPTATATRTGPSRSTGRSRSSPSRPETCSRAWERRFDGRRRLGGRLVRAPARARLLLRGCLRATRSTAPLRGSRRSSGSGSRSRRRTRARRRHRSPSSSTAAGSSRSRRSARTSSFRFEGGVVAPLAPADDRPLVAAAARSDATAGRPWLVLRGGRLEGVLWGGPVLELHTRALAGLGPDILASPPDIDAMLARLRRADRHAHASARRCTTRARRRDREHVDGRDALARAALAVAPPRPTCPSPTGAACSRPRRGGCAPPSTPAASRARRSTGAPGGRARAAAPRSRSRGQGDANRTAYWCPTCQPAHR